MFRSALRQNDASGAIGQIKPYALTTSCKSEREMFACGQNISPGHKLDCGLSDSTTAYVSEFFQSGLLNKVNSDFKTNPAANAEDTFVSTKTHKNETEQ